MGELSFISMMLSLFISFFMPVAMVNQSPDIISELLTDDGTFPNNPKLPLMVYKSAIAFSSENPAATVESTFRKNGWGGSWRNGIYAFHHYHSTAHEVLGIYSGSVTVQLGGPNGIVIDAQKGDVIIIPAGVAHKNLSSTADFGCVGAYPPDQSWDMNYGKPAERPKADQNIANVPLPATDPVYGENGPLVKNWDITK
jgi:uncharacterized protein YjlB